MFPGETGPNDSQKMPPVLGGKSIDVQQAVACSCLVVLSFAFLGFITFIVYKIFVR